MQGIYSWAGARPIEISAELNALCDEQIALTTSFRSSPAVLRTVNTVASALGAAEPLTSHDPASWVEGGYASATQFRTSDEEANWLVGLVRTVSSIRPDWTIGVITRSAWRGREVEAALMEAEVNAHRWSANLGSPEVFSALQGWHERFPTSPLVLLAEDILAELDSDDPHLRADVDQAIRELVAQGITTLRGMMESPHYGAWESTPIPPGVHILNAHQGKGHQFDWVVVLGLEEKHIPDGRARDPNSLREELRVLLVMLSRAKHGLTLTRRAVTQAPWGPSYPRASRWWTLFDSIVRDGDDALEHLQRLT